MKIRAPLFALLLAVSMATHAADTHPLPEPGPEDGGLRLRLLASPRTDTGKEGYEVRVDLINTSDRPVTIRAGWTREDAGDLKDYLDAATSIECVPAIGRVSEGVFRGRRSSPQPEQVLEAGGVLSVAWRTEGRHLKNRVTNPNEVQNPGFHFPGLYSVHATLNVITPERTVALRSNEQLVPVGGSRAMPRSTAGHLLQVDPDQKTATLNLGSRHKVQPGDQFEHHSKGDYWKLTITRTEPTHSVGSIEILRPPARVTPPIPGSEVTLILPK